MGMATAAEEAGILLFIASAFVALLTVVSLWLICGLFYTLSRRDERKIRSRRFIRLTGKTIVYVGIFAIAATFAASYFDRARTKTKIPAGTCHTEHSPDDKYAIDVCTAQKKVVLRLYRLPERHLIAEKTCDNDINVASKVDWEPGEVDYEGCENFVAVKLPPSFLDRLLARLP